MTPTAEASPKTRDLSLDVAKGLGIIIVVIGHAWRGLDSAGMIGSPDLFRLIDTLIYNFHMPLFFLLSGMTYQAWALKRPYPEAALSRVTRLLWPLVLWSYIFVGARIAAGDAANTEVSGWQNLAFFPLPPRDHFWFLWALFLQHLAALALIRAVGRPLGAPVWAALAILLILGSSFTPVGLNPWTFGALTYAGAFLTGLALGPSGLPVRGPAAFVLAAVAFVALQAASFQLPASLLTTQILGILLSLAFLAMVRAACAQGTGPALRLLAFLGVSSMGIYLAHTIFSAGTRVVLSRLTQDLSLHMIAGTLAGIIGPLLIYALIRRFGRPAWIGF
ncbi:acyltransferase family protein [Rhodobacter sp. SY28-1]|uniref:acyltransferase family protein n=1 Tax=Rhodobacter sp. SY28-1 TaxID=2562317 RepID=UPI0010C122F6|nr:acyltransferase [Rhodobacter sp. SY28-1]